MDICLEMVISYLFLVVAFTIDLGEAQNGCDDQLKCGAHGPAIRFPFRLGSQPEQCGYPGFSLSCTDTNDTVIELPISVKLFVKEINYTSQVIQFYDPNHCFPRRLGELNLSYSLFEFDNEGEDLYYREDYALFNCSPRAKRFDHPISCLSGPTYQVYAVNIDTDIADLPISCIKMYNLLSIPSSTIIDGSGYEVLQYKWSTPVCGHCEAKGKKCRLKNNSTEIETECFQKGYEEGLFHKLVRICGSALEAVIKLLVPRRIRDKFGIPYLSEYDDSDFGKVSI